MSRLQPTDPSIETSHMKNELPLHHYDPIEETLEGWEFLLSYLF